MLTYIEDSKSISEEEFFRSFDKHISSGNDQRGREDKFERETYDRLKKHKSALRFYVGNLNTEGIENLILPHHAVEREEGRDPDIPVKVGGQQFKIVISDYISRYIPGERFPHCVKKAESQRDRFFSGSSSVLEADFIFVYNDRELAHKGHYDATHGENRIYMGNGFHRLVAYGLYIRVNGFKPLKVRYCELL